MKVIDLLLQDKRVWDDNKTGYYYLQDGFLKYSPINNKASTVKCSYINLCLALREGEEYIESNHKYIIIYKDKLYLLKNKPIEDKLLSCKDMEFCSASCYECSLHSRDSFLQIDNDKVKFYDIEY